jgi:ferric-dicitrate binding protein FerR (iron transport regulator)
MNTQNRVVLLLDKFTANLCSAEELDELSGYLSTGVYDNLLDEHILQQLRGVTPEGKGLDAARSQDIIDRILGVQQGKVVRLGERRDTQVGERRDMRVDERRDMRVDERRDMQLDEQREVRLDERGGKRLDEQRDTQLDERQSVQLRSKRKTIRRWAWTAAAACIVGAAITTTIWKTNKTERQPAPLAALANQSTQRIENTSSVNIPLQLEDGSRVELHPGAVLIYPIHFAADKRELTLEGDAFFDVARNPDKPFLIYHSRLITRVLGTSFIIKGSKKRQEVQVITGKVEVYENGKGRDADGVIVTPNEKVVYSEEKPFFNLALVDNPVLLEGRKPVIVTASDTTAAFDFERKDMRAIIGQLRDAYGIEIEVESENINNCLFSGDISDLGLYEKLDILCKATGMSYELKGTRILLRGVGCK